RSAVERRALQTVSGSRIGAELRLLAREPDPVAAFETLRELRLDRAAIDPDFGLEDPELARTALALASDDARADLVVLAVAFGPVAAAHRPARLDALAF